MDNKQPSHIYCDFDGTVTLEDGTDALLQRFALPAWQEWEGRWQRGEISSRECLARQVSLVRANRDTLTTFAAELPIDEGIFTLDRACRERGTALRIVSDGLDLIIEAVLRKHGLMHIPFFANHLRWTTEEQPELDFPYAHPSCTSHAGSCKCALTGALKGSVCRTAYIGDGRSDYCVAAKMPTVFAKGFLLDWCTANNIPHHPFSKLNDVVQLLFPQEACAIQ